MRPIQRIPVCLTVKNDIENIEKCLKSIRAQTYPTFIIVNDALSDDGTEKIIGKYADEIIVKGCNIAEGRNLTLFYALKRTNSPYIVMVNSDVVLPPFWIETALKIIKKSKKCGALGSFQKVPKLLRERIIYYLLSLPNPNEYKKMLVPSSNAPCEAVIFRRKALLGMIKRYGYLFNRKLPSGEDPEFFSRMLKLGWEVYLSKELLIQHNLKWKLRDFWKQQKLYGRGLKWWEIIGFKFSKRKRFFELLFIPLKAGIKEDNISLVFIGYFFLLVKLVANLFGRVRG